MLGDVFFSDTAWVINFLHGVYYLLSKKGDLPTSQNDHQRIQLLVSKDFLQGLEQVAASLRLQLLYPELEFLEAGRRHSNLTTVMFSLMTWFSK